MHEFSPRARHPQAPGPGARGEWAAWLPLLFIGAMMFWTVALGLGGWSLMVVSDGAMTPAMVGPAPTATATDIVPGTDVGGMVGSERIPVQMEESQESEDVNDNAGNVGPMTPPGWGADEPPGVAGNPR